MFYIRHFLLTPATVPIIILWVGTRATLDTLNNRKTFCPCLESKHIALDVQSVDHLLYQLCHPGIHYHSIKNIPFQHLVKF